MNSRRWLLLILACLLMLTISPPTVSGLAGASPSQAGEANFRSIQAILGILLLDEDEPSSGSIYKVYIPWMTTMQQ